MGWNISVVTNTVRFTAEQAKQIEALNANRVKLSKADDDTFTLAFDPDDLEHMDYISDLPYEVLDLMEGVIAFTSTEGDNAGDWWAYEFHGKRGLSVMEGKLGDAISCKMEHIKNDSRHYLSSFEIKRLILDVTKAMPNCPNELVGRLRDVATYMHNELKDRGALGE